MCIYKCTGNSILMIFCIVSYVISTKWAMQHDTLVIHQSQRTMHIACYFTLTNVLTSFNAIHYNSPLSVSRCWKTKIRLPINDLRRRRMSAVDAVIRPNATIAVSTRHNSPLSVSRCWRREPTPRQRSAAGSAPPGSPRP